MALHTELPVYKASYDLVLMVFEMVKEFRKDYKYTLGEKLKNEAITLVVNVYRANRRVLSH